MKPRRATVSRALLATITSLLLALVAATSAGAVTGHRLSSSFGTTTPGQLSGVAGVSARSTNGDVFVLDPNTATVLHYAASGDFQDSFSVGSSLNGPTAIAFDASSGDLLLAGQDPNTFAAAITHFSPTGTPGASFDPSSLVSGIFSLATDSNGRVFAAGIYSGTVGVFSSTGDPVTTIDGSAGGGTPFTGVSGLATDSSDNVYVADFGVGVRKFTDTFDAAGTVGTDRAFGVAVDPANDDVYVGDSADGIQCGITRFANGTDRQERFGEVACPSSVFDPNPFFALSVDSTSGTLFAGNRTTNAVDRYVTFTAPGVTTGPAPATPGATDADVTGTVNPSGQADTTYQFEYGTDTKYGSATDPQPLEAVSADLPVTGQLANLKPNTTYHYRVKASNGVGSNYGEDRTFTTAAAPPTVTDEAASNITAFTATLNASVNPNNNDSTAYFEYGPASGGYPLRTPAEPADGVSVGAGSDPFALTANIEGLDPEVTYHFRVVAKNSVDTTTSTGAEFTTKPAPPLATAGAVSGVSGGSAQFSGTVDTQGLAGSVRFVVTAKNSPYSAATDPQSLTPADGSRPVSGSITGLPAGGVFEVRTRVETTTRTVLSEPVTFSTASLAFTPVATPPVITTTPAPAGCVVPRLAQPKKTLTAGKSVTLTGTDFGASGSVRFGSSAARVTRYSPTSISVVVPSKARGKVAVAVTCGRVSNTVTATVAAPKPSNSYRLSTKVKGTKATIKLKVPGRGAIAVSGKSIGSKKASPKKAGTVSLKTGLTKKGRAALRKAKSKRLSVKISVRYRPSGGDTREAERTLTFRR